MSTDLESRLQRLLGRQTSSGDAEERALRRAVAALSPPRHAGWHRGRTLALAFAAIVAVMTVAAGALAAAGALHVSLGRTSGVSPASPASARIDLTQGTHGIAAVLDGKLWLTTRGTRIEGLPVASAELSPHARYVGVGIGHELVVMAPDGHRAWAHATRGTVVAISWAPSGLLLAYIVRRSHGFQLRQIEGDGDHDRLVDPAVRPVRPSWRADSLALAYVGGGGRAVIDDLAHRSRHVPSHLAHVTSVSYAPTGRTLAIAAGDKLSSVGGSLRPRLLADERGTPLGVTWTPRALALSEQVLRGVPAGMHVSYFVIR